MGFRETINRNSGLASAVAVLLVGVCVWFGLTQLQVMGRPSTDVDGAKSFYSDDDGKTYFVDKLTQPTPFDHNGKQAYRAYVFQCDGVKKVYYMEKVAPLDKAPSDGSPQYRIPVLPLREIKRPGDATWLRYDDPRASALRFAGCGSKPAETVLAGD